MSAFFLKRALAKRVLQNRRGGYDMSRGEEVDVLCLPSVNAETPIVVEADHMVPVNLRGSKVTVSAVRMAATESGYRFTVRLKRGDEIELTSDAITVPAGSSVNVAVGLARLDKKVMICGSRASDQYGEIIEGTLRDWGISSIFLPRPSGTASTLVVIERNSGRATLFCHKPPYELDIQRSLEQLAGINAKYIVCTGVRGTELPLVRALFEEREDAVKVLVPSRDLLKSPTPLLNEVFSLCDIFQVNQREAVFMLGRDSFDDPERDIQEILKKITRKKANSNRPRVVIITRGKRGAATVFYHQGEEEIISRRASKADVKDTTGAGDAFLSGFLWAHNQGGLSHKAMIDVGCWSAARNVEELGGNKGMPHLSALLEYLS